MMPGKYAEPFTDKAAWEGKVFLTTPDQVKTMIGDAQKFMDGFGAESESFSKWKSLIKKAKMALSDFERTTTQRADGKDWADALGNRTGRTPKV
jgi:hypothetical protein